MLIPSRVPNTCVMVTSLSRRVNANSQLTPEEVRGLIKLIKKGEC